jgi:hypothetical protein
METQKLIVKSSADPRIVLPLSSAAIRGTSFSSHAMRKRTTINLAEK